MCHCLKVFPRAVIGLAVAFLLSPGETEAANGMNMIGFGGESVAMGGADLAITDSPSAMNINPAGLAWCRQREFDFGISMMDPSVRHSDNLPNDRKDSLDRYPMPFLAYAHPVGEVTVGVGLFLQGGMGAEYRDLVTPPAARVAAGVTTPTFPAGDSVPAVDDTRTNILFAKLTPAVAWRVRPDLTLGASLNIGYARADMRLFPKTSVTGDMDGDGQVESFAGMDLDDASAFGLGLRIGAQFRRGALSLGAAYATETTLDLDDGTMTLNLESTPLGRVVYEAGMSGFAWPRRAGVGAGFRIHPAWLIAWDVDWIDWSSAIETVTIELTRPDNPGAPASRGIPFRMDWKDQWVWAAGVAWNPAPDWALRLGFNHGETPVPTSRLRPLFPAIAEDHLTGGFGLTRGAWIFDLGLEYVFESTKTNDSADPSVNLFGPGSTESLSQFMAHFMLRRTFS